MQEEKYGPNRVFYRKISTKSESLAKKTIIKGTYHLKWLTDTSESAETK